MTIYATIDDARNELSTTTTNTTEDAALYNYLRMVSQRVGHLAGFTFEPVRKTVNAGIRGDRINSLLRIYMEENENARRRKGA